MSSSQDLLNVSGHTPGEQCVIKSLEKDRAGPVRMKPDLKPSKALSSVKAFLPQLAAANTQLKSEMESKPAELFDIEHVEDEAAPVVEMNLSLFELNNSSDSDADSDDAGDSEDEESASSGDEKQLITTVGDDDDDDDTGDADDASGTQ
eukprot:scpid89639/ scgid22361/ Uncharacterized protein C12orf45 homolog